MSPNPHPIKPAPVSQEYHAKDALGSAVYGGLVGGGAGLFASALQNSMAKTSVGAMGVFTRTGSTVAMMTLVPTVYLFAKDASANLREKDDAWNATVGGFLGGCALGLRFGRMPHVLGFGAGIATLMTTLEFSGGSIVGKGKSTELEEYDRKEYMRKNRRRPIEETLVELGEGRGIKPPGYEERRRERILEKYGIEIKTTPADAQGQ